MPQNDVERLAAAGEALFGPTWQTLLAEAYGVSARQMRRYAADDTPIPPDLFRLIGALCEKRAKLLEKWAQKLSEKGS